MGEPKIDNFFAFELKKYNFYDLQKQAEFYNFRKYLSDKSDMDKHTKKDLRKWVMQIGCNGNNKLFIFFHFRD